jgi:predicted dehydrogenase
MPTVELVGISDQRPEHGRQVADRYETAYVQEYTDLLGKVDAVSVATPTHTHYGVAVDCINRGVGLLLEKPLTHTLAEARSLATLTERSNVVLQVGHIERFNPAFMELEEILKDMDVIGLTAQRLSPFDTSGTDADVVFDLMIHDIDLALTLIPRKIQSLQATGRAARTDNVDYAVATLSMQDGPIASLIASRITEQKVRLLEVTTVGAFVTADLLTKSIRVYRRAIPELLGGGQRPLRYRQENLVELIQIPSAEPLQLELQDFLRCVREHDTPKVSAAEGLRALTVAAEISDSIVTADDVAAGRRRDRRAKYLADVPSSLAAVSGGL